MSVPAPPTRLLIALATSSILLLGCGAQYAGTPDLSSDPGGNATPQPGGPDPGNGNDQPSGGSAEAHFDARLKAEMDFCRTCHVPEGVADTDDGRRLLLSENGDDDYQRTYDAWELMQRGVETSLLLTMPAGTADRSHSGGEPWPPESQTYEDMRILLQCWDDADNCSG